MEVILKEDVAKLGNRGDVVKVAEGYGRNYLLPKKLAIEANAANKAVIKQMKDAAVRRSAKEKADALHKKGFNVDRRRIELDQPIKTLGEFTVPIRLHKEVIVKVKAIVEK